MGVVHPFAHGAIQRAEKWSGGRNTGLYERKEERVTERHLFAFSGASGLGENVCYSRNSILIATFITFLHFVLTLANFHETHPPVFLLLPTEDKNASMESRMQY